ncbi:phospho-2-dehydro-3-deoxyheptonate aldolase [Oxobacter pfennigii]|uniref:Phospho-2-dehydro-3-deoxyheptonate aldolase n=1 Tax=Oxobacter pfennigii TaxID=36849 RepID=A0A0P8W4E6_9CLOT|nr:3-deoxy-7-phosphoheptulonate synthase [Oxobacter pfennigii]KPU42349.1 phospho-2-dehydro-3-deoxyheptonate aldolase [Oxobacter pfennigii]
MIITLKPGTPATEIEKMKNRLEELGVAVNIIQGTSYCVFGLVGDTTKIDPSVIQADRNVESLLRVQDPFKLANRLFHPEDTEILVNESKIGKDTMAIIAGTCSIESEEQILILSKQVKEMGASFLRGDVFKPRSLPYRTISEEEVIDILKLAKHNTGLPLVTEVMSARNIEETSQYADVFTIGSRNMQNFELLKEAGKSGKPVILKRGQSSTFQEFLMAAEYIMAEGNNNVILCERGIRTFETSTRSTFDVSSIPALKKMSHLPVIVDPSHASGAWWMVEPLSKAAAAAGADGLMIEVHNDPSNAKCDGEHSIRPETFGTLIKSLKEIAKINNKYI